MPTKGYSWPWSSRQSLARRKKGRAVERWRRFGREAGERAAADLAKAWFVHGDYDKAQRYLYHVGAGATLPPALRAEMNRLSQQIRAARTRQQ
jgi:hypothetical protein